MDTTYQHGQLARWLWVAALVTGIASCGSPQSMLSDVPAMQDLQSTIDTPMPPQDSPGITDAQDVIAPTDTQQDVTVVVPRQPSTVSVNGRQLMVARRNPDGTLSQSTPYDMKGICWSPYGAGDAFEGTGRQLTRYGPTDIPLMAAVHINTVKTYTPFERNANGIAILDALYARGIMVAMTVFAGYDDNFHEASVMAFRDHPAVLMWVVGNEWNYNQLYSQHTMDECVSRVNQVVSQIRALDTNHPIATVWGEVPTMANMAQLPNIDVWGANVYPNMSFGNRFTRWSGQTTKPLFIAEYGSDSYHRNADGSGSEDQAAQAQSLQLLTQQIRMNLSATNSNNVLLGGCPYAWNDEWWKSGDPNTHDLGGFPNPGVMTDGFANEEWWGIVTENRTPRMAYSTLEMLYR